MDSKVSANTLNYINELLKAGLRDREVAQKANISQRTLYTYRAKGLIGGPALPKRGGEIVKSIDFDHVDLPELVAGQKIDGTPDLNYSPAFEDGGSDIPFAEPYVEPETEQENIKECPTDYKPIMRENQMSVSVGIHGKYIRCVFDTSFEEMYLHFDGPKMDCGSKNTNSVKDYFAVIDAIIAELKEAKEYIQSKFVS